MSGGSIPWSEDDWREALSRSQLRLQADRLAKLASDIGAGEDFPNETPVLLCELVRTTAGIIAAHLDVAPRDRLQHIAYVIHEMAQNLRYAERSKMTRTPWSMVEYMESILKATTGKHNHFIIRPQWSYNYGITGDFVQHCRSLVRSCSWIPLAEWEAKLPFQATDAIFSISFPRLERLNCLSHVNWGHELGHILADDWVRTSFAALWARVEPDIQKAIESEVSQNPPQHLHPLFKDTIIKQIVSGQTSKAMDILRQGLTELICDAVGIHLFGPAILSECCEYASIRSLDENPLNIGGYPPWRYRMRKLFDACKDQLESQTVTIDGKSSMYPGGVLKHYVDWLKEVEKVVASNNDELVLQAHVITKETYSVINNEWDQIRRDVLGELPCEFSDAYNLMERSPYVAYLATRLDSDIPPNEYGSWPKTTPATLQDIINAGWAYKIDKMRTEPEWGSQENNDRMLKLLLKAIEASFVAQKYGARLE